MTWTRIEGNWDWARGELQKRWGTLTSEELDVVNGDRELLLELLRERYGLTPEEAEAELSEWERSVREPAVR